jgi:hypothetical protein
MFNGKKKSFSFFIHLEFLRLGIGTRFVDVKGEIYSLIITYNLFYISNPSFIFSHFKLKFSYMLVVHNDHVYM